MGDDLWEVDNDDGDNEGSGGGDGGAVTTN